MESRQAQRSLPLTAESVVDRKRVRKTIKPAEERRRAQGPFGADGHARADAKRASRRQLPAPIRPLNAAHHRSRGGRASRVLKRPLMSAAARPHRSSFTAQRQQGLADRCRSSPGSVPPTRPSRRSRAQPTQALAITEREGDPHEQPGGQPKPRHSLRRVFNLTTNRSNLQSATRSAEIGESSSPTTRTQPRVTSWRPRGRPASLAATWVWGE